MSRYLDSTENLVEVFLDVVEERFPYLQNLSFKLIFDQKKRVRKGKLVLASVELASPKIRYFSRDNIALDGYDYILIVDAKVWELANDADKHRIISHELRHVFIDEKGSPKLIDHDINDFHAEVKLNEDDPLWAVKLSTLVFDIYEQEKDVLKKQTKGGEKKDE